MSKDLIVKGNKLIEASYRLSLIEMRLVLKMVSVIKKDDTVLQDYRFSVRDLLAEFSMNSEDYKEIKKATAGLLRKPLRIKDEEGKHELQVNFISSAKYFEGQGIVKLKFDSELTPYLLQLRKNFTSYQFSVVKKFNNIYGFRIYELVKQYAPIGKRKITLKDLKYKLDIHTHKYRQYGHFKQRVLLPAQKEINKHTGLTIKIEEVKLGRRVEELVFYITSEKKKAPIVQSLDELTKRKQWYK